MRLLMLAFVFTLSQGTAGNSTMPTLSNVTVATNGTFVCSSACPDGQYAIVQENAIVCAYCEASCARCATLDTCAACIDTGQAWDNATNTCRAQMTTADEQGRFDGVEAWDPAMLNASMGYTDRYALGHSVMLKG